MKPIATTLATLWPTAPRPRDYADMSEWARAARAWAEANPEAFPPEPKGRWRPLAEVLPVPPKRDWQEGSDRE